MELQVTVKGLPNCRTSENLNYDETDSFIAPWCLNPSRLIADPLRAERDRSEIDDQAIRR